MGLFLPWSEYNGMILLYILKLSTLKTSLQKWPLKTYLLYSLELIAILFSKTLLDFSTCHLLLRSKTNTWTLWTYSIIYNLSTSSFTLIRGRSLSLDNQTLHMQVLRPISKVLLLTSWCSYYSCDLATLLYPYIKVGVSHMHHSYLLQLIT